MLIDEFISRLEAFAASHGISPATVTSRAVGNSRLYARLKSGGDCGTRVIERVDKYMADNPPTEGEATCDDETGDMAA